MRGLSVKMKRFFVSFATIMLFCPLHTYSQSATNPAAGFSMTDIRQLAGVAFVIGNNRYSRKVKPESLLLVCRSCRGTETIEVRISREVNDAQAKLRSGETTIPAIETDCRARYPDCKIEAAEFQGAVGTVSRMSLGPIAVSSLVLYKNGDTLIIQSLADTPQIAFDNVTAARDQIASQIVGQHGR
jgi:hypothetical protein